MPQSGDDDPGADWPEKQSGSLIRHELVLLGTRFCVLRRFDGDPCKAWSRRSGLKCGHSIANHRGRLLHVAIAILSGFAINASQLNGRSVSFLVLSGLDTGASWLCYFRALRLGDASRVAPLDKLSVVFVLLFAGLFLGERMHWQTILGATLIVVGVVILSRKGH
jgi:uncharacterized membrane protein